MIWRSLKLRLFVAAAICIAGALAIYWVLLAQVFERHVSQRLFGELEAHLNQLTTLLEVSDSGEVTVTETLDDPRFDRPFGGLYWQVGTEAGAVSSSRSLWDQTLAIPPGASQTGEVSTHRDVDTHVGKLLVASRRVLVKAGDGERGVRLLTAMDQGELDISQSSFSSEVAILVSLLAAFLFVAMAGQTLVGLRPLTTLRTRLTDISANRAARLEGRFPHEVEPLVDEVNALLAERSETVERARASAADLAHGLKTPLAILAAEGRHLSETGQHEAAREIDRQVAIMNQHVERQLARTRARGQQRLTGERTGLKPVVEKLVGAFRKLPRGDAIQWEETVDERLHVAMDPMDVEEVVGNILDNARKWAASRVEVTAVQVEDSVALTVSDDGRGVAQGEISKVLVRGGRADMQAPGTGLGLAIAQDILEVYGGRLRFEKNESGGLRVTVWLRTGV